MSIVQLVGKLHMVQTLIHLKGEILAIRPLNIFFLIVEIAFIDCESSKYVIFVCRKNLHKNIYTIND